MNRVYLERNQQDMIVGNRVRQTLSKNKSLQTNSFAFEAEKKVESMSYAPVSPSGTDRHAGSTGSGGDRRQPNTTSPQDLYLNHELAFRRRREERNAMRMVSGDQPSRIGYITNNDNFKH